jgi:hypothetical protein
VAAAYGAQRLVQRRFEADQLDGLVDPAHRLAPQSVLTLAGRESVDGGDRVRARRVQRVRGAELAREGERVVRPWCGPGSGSSSCSTRSRGVSSGSSTTRAEVLMGRTSVLARPRT